MPETPETSTRPWHALSAEEAVRALDSSVEGITSTDAERRLVESGPNVLEGERSTSLLQLIVAQIANPLVYLLFGAAVVSAFAGKPFDAVVIVIIVAANTVIGAAQEFRAEQALAALRRLASPRARVVRDEVVQVVEASTVVPGDILVLETGDRVAADARVITATDLRIDESALTGESDEIYKEPFVLGEDVALADRTNMAWSSTPVTNGRATAVVVATGMDTVVGRIASDVRTAERSASPLQQRLSRLSTWLGVASVAAAVLIFVLGVTRGGDLTEMLLFSVAAAVSVIPEGLPTAVSVALALGVQRMTRRNAIVKRLPAVETLGSTTVICTDKTGTLTRNEMTVTRIWAGGQRFEVTGAGFAPEGEIVPIAGSDPTSPALGTLLRIGCIANNATLELDEGSWKVEGNPTEGALFAAARKGGIPDEPRCSENRVDEIPFSSATKYMATLDRTPAGMMLHVKGAPDRLLDFCDRVVLADGTLTRLDEAMREDIECTAEDMAADALRVVAAAYREMPDETNEADRVDAESGAVFVGLWGLWDPPRDEVDTAISSAKRAGVDVKMISGDHAVTARAIGVRVGILDADDAASTVTGRQLDEMSDDDLAERVGSIKVFARVEPRHKLRIVEALQGNGEIVGMTGDGVNDAPALKKADIGIAMGITGTEVSKEAADMVLADDDFATIVAAIEEGRVLFGNLRRVVAFLIAVSIEQVLLILASQIIGLPLPITAVMILWVNLVSSSMVTIPLGIEPKHDDVLSRPPRPASEGLMDRWATIRVVILGPLVAAGALAVYSVALGASSLAFAQTAAFTTIVVSEWMQALGDRSWTVPIWRLGVRSNLPLFAGIGIGVVLQLIAVSWPPVERVFGTESLSAIAWAAALGVGLVGLAVSQVITLVQGRREGRSRPYGV